MNSLQGDLEIKVTVGVCRVATTSNEESCLDKLFARYSKALRKGVAWLLRFKQFLCKNLKRKPHLTEIKSSLMCSSKVVEAENALFRYVHRVSFPGLPRNMREQP